MPTNPRTGHELITSCSLNTIKLLTTPCRVGHTVFRALAHCGPLCLAKKLKLLFSAAAVMSVVSNSVRPHRWQPTRLPHPWDSPGKNTGVSCHFLLQCRKVKSESEVAQSCLTLSDPMDCSHQAPLSMGFSRQEYWSGVLLPSPYSFLLPSKFRLHVSIRHW